MEVKKLVAEISLIRVYEEDCRLPREAVGSASLEVLKRRVDKALRNMV